MNANKIHIGRVVRFFAGYGGIDGTGAIVAVHGTPSGRPAATSAIRFIRPDDCRVDVILFDGRRLDDIHECSIDAPGIGIKLTDETIADVSDLPELVAAREAELAMAKAKARAEFEAGEAARQIKQAPVFYWNGIKDAKGAKLQKAHYSMGALRDYPAETITIYARGYDGFSDLVRECFAIENDTDIQTDYFDKDNIRVIPAHPLYAAVRAAYDAQQARYQAKYGRAAA